VESLINIESWINEYILHSPSYGDNLTPLYIVGNKTDLSHDDNTQFIDALIKKYNLIWFETSAKTGKHVNDLFTKIAADMIKINKDQLDDKIVDIAEPHSMVSVNYWTSYLLSWGKPKCC
jgi:GTPase SAR1 family protein